MELSEIRNWDLVMELLFIIGGIFEKALVGWLKFDGDGMIGGLTLDSFIVITKNLFYFEKMRVINIFVGLGVFFYLQNEMTDA